MKTKNSKSIPKIKKEVKEEGQKVNEGFKLGDRLLDKKDNRVFVFTPEVQEVVEKNKERFTKTDQEATKWKP